MKHIACLFLFTLAFTNSAIVCRGSLDGPLFVNPL